MNASTIRTLSGFALVVGRAGCKTVGETYSPWEWGAGFQIAPALDLGNGEGSPTVHPTVSYTRIGSGNWVEVDGQLRWDLGLGGQDLWVGGEGLLGRSSGSNGFTLGGLVGVPIGESRWNASLYAGAGISNYGSSGKVVKAGIDVQPWFFPW